MQINNKFNIGDKVKVSGTNGTYTISRFDITVNEDDPEGFIIYYCNTDVTGLWAIESKITKVEPAKALVTVKLPAEVAEYFCSAIGAISVNQWNSFIDKVNFEHGRTIKNVTIESNDYLWKFYKILDTAINERDTNE